MRYFLIALAILCGAASASAEELSDGTIVPGAAQPVEAFCYKGAGEVLRLQFDNENNKVTLSSGKTVKQAGIIRATAHIPKGEMPEVPIIIYNGLAFWPCP